MLFGVRVAVVVPAFNEQRLVARTLATVPGWVDHVIVVDDASLDDTAGAASAAGGSRVEVLRHAANLGVGAAISTGYARAFAAGAEVAAVMAGDGQMHPDDLWAVVAPVAGGAADYAKGDRLSHPAVRAAMPTVRRVGNHALSLLTRIATGAAVRDSQCGYTALSARAYERLGLDALWPRYGYPNDLIGRALIARLRVRDVVVRPVYADETSGIGMRHALFVIPWVLACVFARRVRAQLLPRADGHCLSETAEAAVVAPPLHAEGLRESDRLQALRPEMRDTA